MRSSRRSSSLPWAKWLAALLFVIALLPVSAFTQQGTPAAVVTLEGRPADAFRLTENAKAVVFVFTRVDCPVSNRYAPVIEELSRRFAPRQIAFRLVFLENDESVDRIRQHVADYGLTIPVVRDPSRNLARLAGVTVTPEVAVFSFHHGRPHLVYRGRIDDQYAELGKPRPAPTTHDLEEVLARTGRGEPVLFHATRAVGCFISDIQ